MLAQVHLQLGSVLHGPMHSVPLLRVTASSAHYVASSLCSAVGSRRPNKVAGTLRPYRAANVSRSTTSCHSAARVQQGWGSPNLCGWCTAPERA